MNENKIVQALEKAISDVDAPIGEHWGCGFLTTQAIKDTLDLIERKEAEIEGYKESIREYAEMLVERDVQIKMLQNENEAFAPLGKLYSEIKADAYREFAERAKNKAYPFPCAIGVEYAVSIRGINDTLTELTEEGR